MIMGTKKFVNEESLPNIKKSAIAGIYISTLLVISSGLCAGFFVSFFGFAIDVFKVAFIFCVGLMVVCSAWLFLLVRKNKVLKNNYLVFSFIAPIYLLVAIAIINAHFNIEIVELPSGGIRVVGVPLLYPVFIMLPLGIGDGIFCFHAYVKALTLEGFRRTNSDSDKDNQDKAV